MSDRELRDALEEAQARAKKLEARVQELEAAGEAEVLERLDQLEAENESLRAAMGGHDLPGLLARLKELEEALGTVRATNFELRGQLDTADRARVDSARRYEALRRELAAAVKEQDRLRRLLDTAKDEQKLRGRG